MNEKKVMEKLNAVFQELFEDDDLTVRRETTAADIDEWDSLMHLQLIANVEEAFGIHFTLGEISGFKNVGEMCDCVIKHM